MEAFGSAAQWRGFRCEEFPSASWTASSGSLRAHGTGQPIDLISRRRYRNFRLRLEWCLPAAGNSGILFRVSEDCEQAWQSGPELQLLDDRDHPDGQRPETTCGALYDLLAPESSYYPANGEFNTADARHVRRALTERPKNPALRSRRSPARPANRPEQVQELPALPAQ